MCSASLAIIEGPASDELNLKQHYKSIFIDCYTVVFWGKVFLHTKVLSNVYVSLKENITCPHDFSPLLCVSFAVHNNSKASGVPEVSCDQSRVKSVMPLQKNNSINHGKQSLFSTMTSSGSKYFEKTNIHSDVYLRCREKNYFILIFTLNTVMARFPQQLTYQLFHKCILFDCGVEVGWGVGWWSTEASHMLARQVLYNRVISVACFIECLRGALPS